MPLLNNIFDIFQSIFNIMYDRASFHQKVTLIHSPLAQTQILKAPTDSPLAWTQPLAWTVACFGLKGKELIITVLTRQAFILHHTTFIELYY